MSAPRRPLRLTLLALLVFGLPVVGSLLLFVRPRPDVTVGRDYDMTPSQTDAFVRTAAQRLHWTAEGAGLRFRAEGRVIEARSQPSALKTDGTHLEVSGPPAPVGALLKIMDERLPAIESARP